MSVSRSEQDKESGSTRATSQTLGSGLMLRTEKTVKLANAIVNSKNMEQVDGRDAAEGVVGHKWRGGTHTYTFTKTLQDGRVLKISVERTGTDSFFVDDELEIRVIPSDKNPSGFEIDEVAFATSEAHGPHHVKIIYQEYIWTDVLISYESGSIFGEVYTIVDVGNERKDIIPKSVLTTDGFNQVMALYNQLVEDAFKIVRGMPNSTITATANF